jgi:hypothetical protein
MKKHLLLPILFLFVIVSCSKQAPAGNAENNNTDCNSPAFNTAFAKITTTSSLSDINGFFGTSGDNFRNDVSGSTTIKYYKWYPCSNKAVYYVECWFMADQIILAHKTISDGSCSSNVSSVTFSSLSNGMTYDQVKNIMKENGDLYRTDYNYPGATVKIQYYRFNDCSDNSKYIDAWFTPGVGAILINKNF